MKLDILKTRTLKILHRYDTEITTKEESSEGAGDAETAKDIAMQAAAMRPLYLNESAVPTDVLDHEKEMMKTELINEGKPADKIDMILPGKVKKYYEEVCLENQIYVMSENKETVGNFLKNNGSKLINLVRYEVGEGLEKRQENFAEEVAKQING